VEFKITVCALFRKTEFKTLQSYTQLKKKKKMKKHYLLPIIVAITMGMPALHAQDAAQAGRMNLALRFSTMGAGLELATRLGSHFDVRAGADMLPVSLGEDNYSLDGVAADMTPAFGYVPDYRIKGDIKMTHGHVLADIYPVSRGIFHITAGAFIGTSRINMKGVLVDANNKPAELLPDVNGYWPELNLDGYEIPTDGGRADLEMTIGSTVKPYLGIGLGRSVTRKRFGVKFELGVLRQGDYTIRQNGRLLDHIGTGNLSGDGAENTAVELLDDYAEWMKWYPMVNLQFTFKLF
jgi:hypothetical protein